MFSRMRQGLTTKLTAEKSDPPNYSVAGEGPLGSCHREGAFEAKVITLAASGHPSASVGGLEDDLAHLPLDLVGRR